MAEGLNRATLLGNLGQDPELRSTQGGKSVLTLQLATSERYLDASKTWQERTEWHRVIVWEKRAEGLHKILRKGMRIYVEGSIRTSSYEKDGVKRYSTDIVARSVLLCERAPAREIPPQHPADQRPPRDPQGERAPDRGAPPPADDFGYDAGGGDDEIPF